jgi:hypothetical protein
MRTHGLATAWFKPLLPLLSPLQRTAIGWPGVGSEYWSEATLAGVANRYPDIDLTPYRERLLQQHHGQRAGVHSRL